MEKYFIESQTEVQAISEEKIKVKEAMDKKVSELEASNDRKDKRIVSLETELKRAKEEYEAETNNIRQASAEAAVNLSIVQVKIGDLNDEINHIRRLNKTIGF